jgi:FlaA1/EpsC-like NDP-sugar epimerase
MPGFDVTPEKRVTQLAFMRRQLFMTPPQVTRKDASLEGKMVVITGGNVGMGLEIAKQILAMGASLLIIIVRDEAKSTPTWRRGQSPKNATQSLY